MSRYPEADLGRIRTTRVTERDSKVRSASLARPATDPGSFAQLWDGLPAHLAADDLRALARAIVRARAHCRPVVWMFGAHVIKVGLSPVLLALARENLATLFAVNGAFAIHDAELALWGRTSEEVEAGLHQGTFGMARETAEVVNGAAVEGARLGEGFGESLGRALAARRAEWCTESVLGACFEAGLPVTVHAAIGTDIVHQHPGFSGAAVGDCSARDFRILAAHLSEMAGGAVVNVGSAVILPEVFLKAFSVAANLGASSEGLVTASLDFVRQYRPLRNVVQRPPGPRGHGYAIVGHHEILLPILHQGLRLERSRLEGEGGPAPAAGPRIP
jgi:hypothetical protein